MLNAAIGNHIDVSKGHHRHAVYVIADTEFEAPAIVETAISDVVVATLFIPVVDLESACPILTKSCTNSQDIGAARCRDLGSAKIRLLDYAKTAARDENSGA